MRGVGWFGTQSALRAAKERVTGGGASRRASASFGERTGSRTGRSETPEPSELTVAGQRLCVSKWLRMTSTGQFPGLSCGAQRSSSDHAPQRWSERRWSENNRTVGEVAGALRYSVRNWRGVSDTSCQFSGASHRGKSGAVFACEGVKPCQVTC